MKRIRLGGYFIILLSLSLFFLASHAVSSDWQKLEEGLFVGEFDPEKRSRICNHKVVIIKINPRLFSLRLLSASEYGLKSRTAREWCEEFKLSAAINASMYQGTDMVTSTGYMKNYGHINNPYINKQFGAFLAFNPIAPDLPEVQIIDRRTQRNWEKIIDKYNSVVQNYRMISQGNKSGWPQQNRVYSTAAIGLDKEGNILFILSRAPYSTYDFIHILLSMPIHIETAIYAEGGADATLCYSMGDRIITLLGRCESLDNMDVNRLSHNLPNILGIIRK